MLIILLCGIINMNKTFSNHYIVHFVSTLGMVYSYNDPSVELGQFHKVKAGLRLHLESSKKLTERRHRRQRNMWMCELTTNVSLKGCGTTLQCHSAFMWLRKRGCLSCHLFRRSGRKKEVKRVTTELLCRQQKHTFPNEFASQIICGPRVFSLVAWIWLLSWFAA